MHFLPSLEDPFFDPDQWEEVLTLVQGHEDEYLVFQKMDTTHAFRVMENFTGSLKDSTDRSLLEAALFGARPFHFFNERVERSELREEWANYKFQAHKDWVRSQVECYELVS